MEAVNEIILVDDASSDRTFEIAKTLRAGGLPITAKKHSRNSGYGANQKTCYAWQWTRGRDCSHAHPDYQYDPKLIRYSLNSSKGYFDVMSARGYGREKNASKAACQGINIIPTAFFPLSKTSPRGEISPNGTLGCALTKQRYSRIFLSKHSQMTLFLIHRFFWQLRKTIFISAISLCPCGILKKHRPSTFCAVRGTVFLRSGRSPNFWQEDRSAGLKFGISVNLINGRYSHFKFARFRKTIKLNAPGHRFGYNDSLAAEQTHPTRGLLILLARVSKRYYR